MSQRNIVIAEIDELYRELDARTTPPMLHANGSARLKHAVTDARFDSGVDNMPQKGQRFDSHNILRSDETSDLVHLPEEQQIWLKRTDGSTAQSIASVLDPATISSSRPILSTIPPQSGPSTDSIIYAKPGMQGSKSEHHDLVHRKSAGTPLLSPMEEYDTHSIRSSEKSKSTARKSEKSLTRRLSSFFTRSFRRKRSAAGSTGDASKRQSYAASTVASERPGSADTHLSLEDTSDYFALRSQQLLRLGFSLDIDEALRNEPDSFVFVPLTDSGYFSSAFDEVEKLPQISPSELAFEEEFPSPSSAGDSSAPVPPPRRHHSSTPEPPQRHQLNNEIRSQESAKKNPKAHNRQLMKGHTYSPGFSTATTPDEEQRINPRRLSFVEGTSIMESINHLAYPSSPTEHGNFSYEDLHGLPPPSGARRAKEKLRFKRHPWKWIKSKF